MPRSDYESRIERIKQFLDDYPILPVIVACRVRDYTLSLDLPEIKILPLDPDRIRDFTRRYLVDPKVGETLFWKLAGGEPVRRTWQLWKTCGATWEEFWSSETTPEAVMTVTTTEHDKVRKLMRSPRSLINLAGNPFMLFMLSRVYAKKGELPTNRGKLFEAFVVMLFEREEIGSMEYEIQRGLGALAFSMQQEGREGTAVSLPFARSRLAEENIADPDWHLQLAVNASILAIGDRVRFSHQLLQEYFAGTHLDTERISAASIWESHIWWKPTGWEETAILRAGQLNDATPLVRWLLEVNPVLAYRCMDESGAAGEVPPNILERLRWSLRGRMTDPETAPIGRAETGRVINFLPDGDPREGIGLNAQRVPDIHWCYVPRSSFLLGSHDTDLLSHEDEKPLHELLLDDFHISKYPITNAQFEPFIATEYNERKWWTDLGWSWKGERTQPQVTQYSRLANYPRVNVTWHEVIAYCKWLTFVLQSTSQLKNDEEIILPTEAQWAKTARGADARLYTWGDEWEPLKGNVDETGIEDICAVGLFPDGVSPYRTHDMTGNIWEWCLSEWANYPYQDDSRNDLNSPATKVVRGGAFGGGQHSCRCEYRGLGDPGFDSPNLGFRIVRIRSSQHSLR
jgi:formylglycine-generating enzyme required for sulfatase activity